VRDVVQLFLKVAENGAELEVRRAEYTLSLQDYENRVPLVPIGAVSKEEFEHAEMQLKSGQARMKEAEYALGSAFSLVQGVSVRDTSFLY